jgi:hypothetical protein
MVTEAANQKYSSDSAVYAAAAAQTRKTVTLPRPVLLLDTGGYSPSIASWRCHGNSQIDKAFQLRIARRSSHAIRGRDSKRRWRLQTKRIISFGCCAKDLPNALEKRKTATPRQSRLVLAVEPDAP